MSPGTLHHRRIPRPAWALYATLLACILLSACASKHGADYKKDAPGIPPSSGASTPDAVPRIEPLSAAASRPYTIRGQRYTPMSRSQPFSQTGLASWYGRQFHGNNTASGERYDMYAMTGAHPTLPLPSYARVTRLDTGKSVIVRVNDRGPFNPARIIDLSWAAAAKLGFTSQGTTRVRVQAITHDDIRRGQVGRQENRPATGGAAAASSTPVYLQFGAFQQADNAQRLRQTLTWQLPAADRPRLDIYRCATLHHVRLGPYTSRTDALADVRRIQRQIGQAPVLTSLHCQTDGR